MNSFESIFSEAFDCSSVKKKNKTCTPSQERLPALLKKLTIPGRPRVVADLGIMLGKNKSTIYNWRDRSPRHRPHKDEADAILARIEQLENDGFFDPDFDFDEFRHEYDDPNDAPVVKKEIVANKKEDFVPMYTVDSKTLFVEKARCSFVDPVTDTIIQLNDRRSDISDQLITIMQKIEDLQNSIADLETEDKDLEVTVNTLRRYIKKAE